MTWSQLLAFAIAAEALLLVPGPSVLFVIARGITYGRRAGLATAVGNDVGTALQAVAVAAGLGAVVATSTAVFTAMKLAGAVYLVYLGIRAFRERRRLREALAAGTPPVRSTRQLLRDGFVVGATNPKTTLFFLAVLPQFVHADGGSASLQLLALGLLYVVLALVSDGAYGIAAGSVRAWLERSPRRLEAVGGAGGLLMVALGVRLAFTGRTD
jgi:threonine/homoserine/homoserine lactone efflux protein